MTNEKWSKKEIISTPSESTRLCVIDGDEMLTNKTISSEDLVSYHSFPVVNRSLDKMQQLIYRNLEGDNMLAPYEFSGRVRAIETPMTLAVNNGTEIIINNVPYVPSLIENPGNWMVYYEKASGWDAVTINSAIRIISIEYLTNNQCKFTLVKPLSTVPGIIEPVVGQKMYIASFLASNMTIHWEPLFKSNTILGSWNNDVVSVGAIIKHSDGTYRAIVGGSALKYGDEQVVPTKRRYNMKWFASDTLFGTWTNQGNNQLTGIFDDLLPAGYEGFAQAAQTIPHPLKKGYYLMFLGMYNSSNTLDKHVIIEFDENLNNRRLIQITHTYTPTIGYSQIGYGCSIAYYKGRYFISLQDGTHITGKRVVLSSSYLEGPYTLDSTIIDWTNQPEYKQPGSIIGYSIANSFLYVFNNELYCITSGEGVDRETSGSGYKHQAHLFKYNDSGIWTFVKGPILLSLHGDNDNYPEYPNIGYNVGSIQGEFGGWGKAHLGQCNFHHLEGSKLIISYGSSGWGQNTTASYQVTAGYIDLAK